MDSTDVVTAPPSEQEESEDEFGWPALPPAPGEPFNPALHDASGLDPETRRKILLEALEEGIRQARNGECTPFDFDELIAELDAES